MLVHQLLQNGYDNDTAVIDRGRCITYARLRQLTRNYANYLYEKGVRRGDRVAIFSRKTVHYIAAYMAISRLGAIAVPINVQLSQREVAYILRDSESHVLITSTLFDWDSHPKTQDLTGHVTQLVIDEYTRTEAAEAPALSDDFTDKEPYIIIYTSGTTGTPKGALLSHYNVTYNASQIQEVLHIRRDDAILCVLPLYHCFCLIYRKRCRHDNPGLSPDYPLSGALYLFSPHPNRRAGRSAERPLYDSR